MTKREDTPMECLGKIDGSTVTRIEQGNFGFQAWVETKYGKTCRYRVEEGTLLEMFKKTPKFIGSFNKGQSIPRLSIP